MTFIYNKLWNKQDGFLNFSNSYLHKGKIWWNDLKKTYKPFDLIKLCLFYGNICIFDLFCNVNNSFTGSISCKYIFNSYCRKSLILTF
jgi:hypothetical protein